MAIGDASAYDRQKKIDQMRMGRGKTSAGPLRQVTQDSKGNTTVSQRPADMPMPTVLPQPMAKRRGPLPAPDLNATTSRGATVTPSSGVMRDRAMAIPTAADAARAERPMAKDEPRSYANFAEFMKTMGLGK